MKKNRSKRLLKNRCIGLKSGLTIEHDGDFPVYAYSIKYTLNLIEKIKMNTELLNLILALLNIKERQDFIEFLYRDLIKDDKEILENKTNYYDIMNNINMPDYIGEYILSDIEGSDLRLKEDRVLDFIKGLLINKLEPSRKFENRGFKRKLSDLADLFGLDSKDIDILLFLYCVCEINSNQFSSITGELNFQEFIRLTSAALSFSQPDVKKRLSLHGRLFQSGVIEEITPNTGYSNFFEIDDTIFQYLSGISDISLIDKYIKKDNNKAFDIHDFSISEEKTDLILSLLSSNDPCNLLLYGKAGTGKTEFARSLAASTGNNLYFVQYGEEQNSRRFRGKSGDVDDRTKALNIAVRTVPKESGIIVVDEADFILNTGSIFFSFRDTVEKGWLNHFIDNTDAKIIWISNKIGLMEDSTLRRFSYSLYFKDFDSKDREKIWANQLKNHPLKKYINRKLVESLSSEFEVNAGAIGSALDAIESVFSGMQPTGKGIEKTLREILGRHEAVSKGLTEKKGRTGLNDITGMYDISALNTDIDAGKIAAAAAGFAGRLKNEPDIKNTNMNLLFWGMPGTGKTEFVKYLAKESKMNLLVKRYSDLESKWVGETEKNIANAFREAMDKKAILFVDEADSFFTSREDASRSWEVSRTNEFLTQMENFTGILVCCTNLLPDLDRAAMRRFNWKVEFKSLKKKAKLDLYKKYFRLKGRRLSRSRLQRIMDIPGLTPGDIKAVSGRLGFIPSEDLNHGLIVDELLKEVGYRSAGRTGRVGF